MICNADKLKKFISDVMKSAGLPEMDSKNFAESLINADMRGISSHGTTRMKTYYKRLRDGIVDPKAVPEIVSEMPSFVIIDGNNAMGVVSGTFAMETCIRKAKETGACFAGVRGGNHYGYAGYYAQMAAKEGMIGIAKSTAASACAPYGGKEPLLGTNPLAIAIPSANREPFLLDMATSLVARGKVKLAEKDGRPIPADWALDVDGNPTTDPSKARTMVPCGGYKGFGISLAIEILCSALSGAKTSATVGELYDLSGCHQDLGFFFGVLNVGGVTDLNRFENSVDSLITSMKESPKAAGVGEIFVAGEIENRKQKISQAEGVNISDAVIRELREVSEMSGIPFECEF